VFSCCISWHRCSWAMAVLPCSCSASYVGTPQEGQSTAAWSSSSAAALPLAAQAAQAAQLHGAAAAHAAQTAQAHVHAAQAAHALAQQAADQLRGIHRQVPPTAQPPLAPEGRCLSARPSRECLPSPQPQVTHWSYTSPQPVQYTSSVSSVYSTTPSKYVTTVRQYSTQSTSVQLPTPQGTPSSAPRRSHPAQLLGPVEELRRFPNLDNQKPEEKNDKNDPQVSQDHPLMQRPPPEVQRPTLREDPDGMRRHLQALPKTPNLGRTQSSTPEPSPGRHVSETERPAPATPTLRPRTPEVVELEDSDEAARARGMNNGPEPAPMPDHVQASMSATAALATVKAIPESPAPSSAKEADISLPHAVPTDVEVDSTPTLPPTLASVEVAPPPPPSEVEVPAELVTEMEVPLQLDRSASRTETPASDPAAAAAEALRSAVGRRDVLALRSALTEAVSAGTSWELIEWAHDRSRDIEHEAWGNRLKESAMGALSEVLARTSALPETVSAACEYAWEAGVPAELLDSARQECGRRQLRQAAEQALLLALAERSSTLEVLEPVLQRAEKAGVEEELLHHARRRMEDLRDNARREESASMAEKDLEDHLLSATSSSQLEEALDAALRAHAPRKALDHAWQKKAMLDIQTWQAKKGDLGKRRPSVTITSVPVKESTPTPREENLTMPWVKECVSTPREEKVTIPLVKDSTPTPRDEHVTMPWVKDAACSSKDNYRGDSLAQSQGRWTVPPRLPTGAGAEASSPPPRTPPPRLRSRDKDEASSEVRDFRSQGCRPAIRNG